MQRHEERTCSMYVWHAYIPTWTHTQCMHTYQRGHTHSQTHTHTHTHTHRNTYVHTCILGARLGINAKRPHTMSHHHTYYVTSSYILCDRLGINAKRPHSAFKAARAGTYYVTSSYILCHIIIHTHLRQHVQDLAASLGFEVEAAGDGPLRWQVIYRLSKG